MKDRLLGYAVITVVFIFLVLPVGYLVWKNSVPVTTRTIAFAGVKTLSFLSVQDPVSLQGVEIGVVLSITNRNDTSFVNIEMLDTIRLYDDYTIKVIAKGVMGDRYLSIMPGDNRRPVVPPPILLHGTVDIGPDDALSYMHQLQSALHTLTTLSEELKNGTAHKQSFVRQVWQFSADMDSIIRSTLSLVCAIDTSLKRGIDSTVSMLDSALVISRNFTEEIPSGIATISTMVASMDTMLTKVGELVVEFDSVIGITNDQDFLLWKKYTGSVNSKLIKLQKLFEEIQGEPLTLPVRLW